MLFSLEVTLRPSNLERLAAPDAAGNEELDNDSQQDNKKELECDRVMNKCYGELLFISIYVGIILLLVVAVVYQIKFGKIKQCLIEFAICLAIDQGKTIPCQALIYWVVIRRFGTLAVTPDFQDKWDDETINAGGQELGLFFLCRKKVQDFIERKDIADLILGMTIFLCIQIFAELAFDEQI